MIGADSPAVYALLIVIAVMMWLLLQERKEHKCVIKKIEAKYKEDRDFLREQAKSANARAHRAYALRTEDNEKIANVMRDTNVTLTLLTERIQHVQKQ